MSATIRDVAERAGVGLATVSRVVNNSPLVSPATRQRVLNVIAELRYTPHQAARSLSLGKTLTVTTIAPFFTRPSVVERLRGVEANLADSGYQLIVCNVETVERRDICLRDLPRKERSDGVLIISLAPHPEEVTALQQPGVAVVLIDTYVAGMTCVFIDDQQGGYIATRHLLDLGHERIAYISDPLTDPFNFTSSRDRYAGYRQALTDAGMPFCESYHRSGMHGRYEARRLATELLSLDRAPTAIFAASDTQALGVLEAAHDIHLRVPDDLSVIGYDDIEIAEYLGLTTIRQPLFETGARGVELLLERLGNLDTDPVSERMPVELVIRRTTAAPRKLSSDAERR